MRLNLSPTETRLLQAQSSLSRISIANAGKLRERAEQLAGQADEIEALAQREIREALGLIAEAHEIPEGERRDMIEGCVVAADMTSLEWDPVEPAPSLEEARAEAEEQLAGQA